MCTNSYLFTLTLKDDLDKTPQHQEDVIPRCAEEGKQNHILEQLAFSDPSRVTYGGIVYMKSVSADVEITTRLVISTSARQIYHLFARMCMKIFIRVLCVGFRSGSNVPAYQSDGIFCYEYELKGYLEIDENWRNCLRKR
ncbi:hypothetical protein T4B_14526 [Trichinella pseudospiralis]|uniref:Uncharacterized protein n=1 Tax=Trichinella pseudospiralis TaxID=6337 RepID=A0A0V1JPU8_TRIPS|nr:hypothetical protein T4B_14526 [Trichinella pseudospiralis]KRZ37001.1 hypothetical protein T4C_6095 [Trichinella pseudospiralis]